MVISSVCFLVDENCASFLMGGSGCGLNCCLALVERAVLSKTLIQLSSNGQGCAPSLLFVWSESVGFYSMVIGELQEDLMLRHISQGRTLLAHTSAGDPQALTGGSGSVSSGGHCSFLLSPGVHKILFVPFKGLCSLQSYGRSIIKPYWPSKSDSLGIPSSLAKTAGWGA